MHGRLIEHSLGVIDCERKWLFPQLCPTISWQPHQGEPRRLSENFSARLQYARDPGEDKRIRKWMEEWITFIRVTLVVGCPGKYEKITNPN